MKGDDGGNPHGKGRSEAGTGTQRQRDRPRHTEGLRVRPERQGRRPGVAVHPERSREPGGEEGTARGVQEPEGAVRRHRGIVHCGVRSPARAQWPLLLGNGTSRQLLLFSLCFSGVFFFSVFSKQSVMKMDSLHLGSGKNMGLERKEKKEK